MILTWPLCSPLELWRTIPGNPTASSAWSGDSLLAGRIDGASEFDLDTLPSFATMRLAGRGFPAGECDRSSFHTLCVENISSARLGVERPDLTVVFVPHGFSSERLASPDVAVCVRHLSPDTGSVLGGTVELDAPRLLVQSR